MTVLCAIAAIAGGTLTPIRDDANNVIGTFELWKKKKKVGGKKINFPTGWVAYLHGYEGKSLVSRMQGSEGFGIKGSV